jgi:Zn-dependent protease
MGTRRTFQLARVFGIRISVGISWFVILFLFIFTATPYFHDVLGGSRTAAYLVAVASVLSFFVSLILHELGHAIVGRRNGFQVLGIDLWALGGIARMNGEASTPGVEFRIAAAGPLVTLLVIAACVVVGGLLTNTGHFFRAAVGSSGVHETAATLWLSWLFTINVLVLLFNLVPAFPLDGGRMAHALVWWRTGDRNRATRATARVGQGFAVLLGVGGLFLLVNGYTLGIWFALIALFIYQGASAAVVSSNFSQRIEGVTVADIMDREPVAILSDVTLLDAREQFFLRYREPWFAVVDAGRHFLGLARSERIDAEIEAGRPALTVAEVVEDDDQQVRIGEDQPLEALLRAEGLRRLGAMFAVDADGVLRGVVTLAEVRRALTPARL